jgi:4-carboxymuconolactone decarboxylase
MVANKADYEKGVEIRKKLFKDRYGKGSAIAELAPELDELVTEVVFGRVWSRPQLDLRMRSVAIIAALTALGRFPQLKNHILNGLNSGLTKEEIIEVLIQMAFYAGVPAVSSAFQIAKEAFAAAEK